MYLWKLFEYLQSRRTSPTTFDLKTWNLAWQHYIYVCLRRPSSYPLAHNGVCHLGLVEGDHMAGTINAQEQQLMILTRLPQALANTEAEILPVAPLGGAVADGPRPPHLLVKDPLLAGRGARQVQVPVEHQDADGILLQRESAAASVEDGGELTGRGLVGREVLAKGVAGLAVGYLPVPLARKAKGLEDGGLVQVGCYVAQVWTVTVRRREAFEVGCGGPVSALECRKGDE